MRVVLDTNVLLSAFISRGHCHELLELCAREHQLVTSAFILDEFQEKLLAKFKVPPKLAAQTVQLLRSRMTVVTPEPLAEPLCRDPDDDHVLATAFAAQTHCLVTGDSDLLVLKEYRGTVILRPAEFWGFVAKRGP